MLASGGARDKRFHAAIGTCQRTRLERWVKRHLSRAEWKFGGPLEGIRGGLFCLGYQTKNLTSQLHDRGLPRNLLGGGTPSGGAGEHRWRNCAIFNILDDGYQVRSEFTRIEYGYCYFLNSAWFGHGVAASEGPDPNPGQRYMHHCVLDLRAQKCSEWQRNPHGQFPCGTHSPDNNAPLKMYNNLMIYMPDTEGLQDHGFYHNNGWDNTAAGTAGAHEDFNNILIRHDTQRYDMTVGFAPGSGPRDGVATRISCDADFANEYHDFNLYYRDVPEKAGGGFKHSLLYNIRESKGSGSSALTAASAKPVSLRSPLSRRTPCSRSARPAGQSEWPIRPAF